MPKNGGKSMIAPISSLYKRQTISGTGADVTTTNAQANG